MITDSVHQMQAVTTGEVVLPNQNEFPPPARETRSWRVNGTHSPKLCIPWPDPMRAAAHIGILGELVSMTAPHTESDPAALLLQTLTAFGNLIGRNAHFTAESDKHFCNLNVVLVGDTSKGRKGSSWGHVMRVMERVDESWKERQQSGLSTGEGLIHAVRDPVIKREPIKEGGRITDYEEVVADGGVRDKRLLVLEAEFAQVLKVSARESNILSAIIRLAWDSGNLRTLTKNSPAVATAAHVTIIGHITKDELLRYLSSTDCANGLANRFLWLCVRRSKALPEGGAIHTVDFSAVIRRLQLAKEFATTVGRIERDPDARALWHEVYEGLSGGKPGLLGMVTSRAEAQVMRLATIYAVLDCSRQITLAHLQAALAVWDYCEASARHIFGVAVGNPIADKIFQALQDAGARGMTRTAISAHFGRHHTATELNAALAMLVEAGMAVRQTETTGGRPLERWFSR